MPSDSNLIGLSVASLFFGRELLVKWVKPVICCCRLCLGYLLLWFAGAYILPQSFMEGASLESQEPPVSEKTVFTSKMSVIFMTAPDGLCFFGCVLCVSLKRAF
jgi:hypothetical protein